MVEESTGEDEVKNQEQPQTVVEDSQNLPTDVSEDKALISNEKVVDSAQELTPKDSFVLGDNFEGVKNSYKAIKFVSQDQKHKYESGTIGQRYSRFLVSVNSEAGDGNADWWNTQYTEKYLSNSDREETKFQPLPTSKKLTKAYDKNLSEDSLNGLCHSIYKLKQTKEEIKRKDENNDHSIWEGLWIFCSPEKYNPDFIESDSKPKIDEISYQFKDKLLSTDEEWVGDGDDGEEESEDNMAIDNKFIWQKLNYHFTTEEVEDTYFKSFKNSKSVTEIRKICESGYKIKKTVSVGASRPSDAALLKYCSLGD